MCTGYNLLLKIEYKGRTLWDCSGRNSPNPWSDPSCTVIPPGGLQGRLHLQVLYPWQTLTAKCSCTVYCHTDLSYPVCRKLIMCQALCCHGKMIAEQMLLVQENTEMRPWEAVVLIAWLIFFRYMVYIALRYKTAAPETKRH